MRIAVTGGAGFIGSHVVKHFHGLGHDVMVVDNFSRGDPSHLPRDITLSSSDVLTLQSAADVVRFRPNAVVHLAAQMSVVASLKDPIFDADVNVLGTLNMLEAARQCAGQEERVAFVFASSGGALYGDAKQIPSDESTPIWPQSPYGVSKASAEHYVDLYDRRPEYHMRCVSLRFANVYGEGQSDGGEGGVISKFADSMANGYPAPRLFGDGTQTRDYIFVDDVVRATECALASEAHGAFNIGTGRETSLLDVASRLRHLTGYSEPLVQCDARDGEVLRSCLSIDRARQHLHWQPQVDLNEGLQRMVDSVTASARQSSPKQVA